MSEVGLRAVDEDLIVRRLGPAYAQHPMIVIATSDEWLDRGTVELAEVVSVGPNVREDVTAGVQILIGRYGGDAEFTHGGVEYSRCQVADVVAVLPSGSQGVS